VKPPRRLPEQVAGGGIDALEYELLQEIAFNLARLSARLDRALEALAASDREREEGGAPGVQRAVSADRDVLLAAAAEALWYLVVQREVSGLRDHREMLRHHGVPREVQLRMGVRPAATPAASR
jgi:hypothetical protein